MLLNAPLIRLRHLLPPQKNRGGEGLSIKRVARGFGVKCCRVKSSAAPYIEKGRCK
jgi:hypothetical protein